MDGTYVSVMSGYVSTLPWIQKQSPIIRTFYGQDKNSEREGYVENYFGNSEKRLGFNMSHLRVPLSLGIYNQGIFVISCSRIKIIKLHADQRTCSPSLKHCRLYSPRCITASKCNAHANLLMMILFFFHKLFNWLLRTFFLFLQYLLAITKLILIENKFIFFILKTSDKLSLRQKLVKQFPGAF